MYYFKGRRSIRVVALSQRFAVADAGFWYLLRGRSIVFSDSFHMPMRLFSTADMQDASTLHGKDDVGERDARLR
jgi:hypothetical protein